MGPFEYVLIVEDEDEWCGVYQRAVAAQVSSPITRVAKSLAHAERLLAEVKFAVAFVDVGLDASDDRNVDGLRVMEKIRAAGDETSIVVVTGRSGRDVVSITRDAIKKYNAYDTVGKSSITPSQIRGMLAGALEAYRQMTGVGREAARDALCGKASPMAWDDEMMRMIGFKVHAWEFYEFLNSLLGAYLPIIEARDCEAAKIDHTMSLFYGYYWSRAIGAAVLVCVGASDTFDETMSAARAHSGLFTKYNCERPIKELTGPGVKGTLFLLDESV